MRYLVTIAATTAAVVGDGSSTCGEDALADAPDAGDPDAGVDPALRCPDGSEGKRVQHVRRLGDGNVTWEQSLDCPSNSGYMVVDPVPPPSRGCACSEAPPRRARAARREDDDR